MKNKNSRKNLTSENEIVSHPSLVKSEEKKEETVREIINDEELDINLVQQRIIDFIQAL